jgi:hypothetical protein
MKTKKNVKGLSLSKETISNLNSIRGGIPPDLTNQCITFDLSNCETWEVVICKRCPTTLSVCIICP